MESKEKKEKKKPMQELSEKQEEVIINYMSVVSLPKT